MDEHATSLRARSCGEIRFSRNTNHAQKPNPPKPWWCEAAELMVRYDLSLREAAAQLGVNLSIDQTDGYFETEALSENPAKSEDGLAKSLNECAHNK